MTKVIPFKGPSITSSGCFFEDFFVDLFARFVPFFFTDFFFSFAISLGLTLFMGDFYFLEAPPSNLNFSEGSAWTGVILLDLTASIFGGILTGDFGFGS